MRELRHNDAYDALGHHPTMSKRLSDGIGKEVMLTGILLDSLSTLLADTRRILKGTRHRRYRNSKLPSDILHCHWRFLVHQLLTIGDAKIQKTFRYTNIPTYYY
jgi:hypothetical protein